MDIFHSLISFSRLKSVEVPLGITVMNLELVDVKDSPLSTDNKTNPFTWQEFDSNLLSTCANLLTYISGAGRVHTYSLFYHRMHYVTDFCSFEWDVNWQAPACEKNKWKSNKFMLLWAEVIWNSDGFTWKFSRLRRNRFYPPPLYHRK